MTNEVKLTKSQVKQWTEAMRSGRYRQITGTWISAAHLRSGGSPLKEGERPTEDNPCFACAMGVLNHAVLTDHRFYDSAMWAGRRAHDMKLSSCLSRTVMCKNDNEQASFDEIADFVEDTILPLAEED
tara:strand:+ start:109 stop:492 length:384 start_codon:yes stop_codon:yes gene_type:complete